MNNTKISQSRTQPKYWLNQLKRYWLKFWPYLIFIFIAFFVLWAQKNTHSFYVASDSVFHTNQFYESAMQLKTGHFSWFMTLFGFHQTGRIVNGVYGPVFSYLMGGILDLLGTWSRLQLLMNFTVLIMSGMLMYHLARYCNIKRYLSIIVGIFYMVSFPITVFLHGEAFTGIGNAVMPLVILMGIKMWKEHRVRYIRIAVLLALIMQAHLLTTVISVIALIPFGCASLYHNKHVKKWLKQLAIAIVMFFLLTCNLWGALLEVFGSNYILKPFANTAMGSSEFSIGWFHNRLSLFTRPYDFLGLLILAVIIVEWKKLSRTQKFIPLLGIGFLFLSSTYFPWTMVSRIIPILTQTIQIPSRFLGVACILLLITLGKGLQRLHQESVTTNGLIRVIVMLMLLILAGDAIIWEESNTEYGADMFEGKEVFVGDHSNFHQQMKEKHLKWIRNAYRKDHRLSRALKYTVKSIPDYLPTNKPTSVKRYDRIAPYKTELHELIKAKFVNHHVHGGNKNDIWTSVKLLHPHHYKHYVTNQGLVIKWNQPKKKLNHDTQIPAVKYAHTNVQYNHRNMRRVRIDDIGAIHVKPKHKHNEIKLTYKPSAYWYTMMYGAISSWILLIAYLVIIKDKKVRKFTKHTI